MINGEGETPVEFLTDSLDKEDIVALKAVSMGEGNEYQQKRVMNIIVKGFSRTHDMSYIPNNPTASAFMEGRRFVGNRILYYINFPASKLDKPNT